MPLINELREEPMQLNNGILMMYSKKDFKRIDAKIIGTWSINYNNKTKARLGNKGLCIESIIERLVQKKIPDNSIPLVAYERRNGSRYNITVGYVPDFSASE